MKIDIVNGKTGKTLLAIDVSKSDSILDIKKLHIKQSTCIVISMPTFLIFEIHVKIQFRTQHVL